MKLTLQKLACFILLALISINIQAQKFHLVKDINNSTDANPSCTTYLNTGKYSNSYVVLNDISYFSASDGIHGNELWRSDGTNSGTYMVKDINKGLDSSSPYGITIFKGKIYFIANDGVHGLELWQSDGTLNGTALLKDINPGLDSSSPSFLMSANNSLFFFISKNGTVRQLWKSDGTASGTKLLKDLTDSIKTIEYPAKVGKYVCFFAYTSAALTQPQLWRTDGTDSGTIQVKNIGFTPTIRNAILSDGKTLYFSDIDNNLWKSDGTYDGTFAISNTGNWLFDFVFLNNKLVFTSGYNLFKSDGTANGTSSFFFNLGTFSYPVTVGNKIFFILSYATSHQLWETDATTNGTVLVKDFGDGYFPSGKNLTAINDTLYFSGYTQTNGFELWKSDGTTEGTTQIKDIFPGSSSSNASYFTPLKSKVLFSADDGQHGKELWSLNTISKNLNLLKDINVSYTSGARPSKITAFNNELIFAANTNTYGNELWKTDGTQQGTALIRNIENGSESSIDNYYPSVPFFISGNNTYFIGTTQVSGAELWKTSGDSTSTNLISDLSPGQSSSQIFFGFPQSFHQIADIGGRLYYAASPASFFVNYNLFTTDGHTNTNLDTSYYSISNLTPFGKKLFYIKNYPPELWIIDSLPQTKKRLNTAYPDNRNSLFTYNNNLYYGSSDGYMWRTDGTDANNYRFRKIRPDPYYKYIYNDINSDINIGYTNANAVLKGKLYFAAFDSTNGSELWKSDGSSTGTVLIKDINVGIGDSKLGSFVSVDSIIYFFADDGIHGRELWETNGTIDGTILVKDITKGKASSEIFSVTAIQHKIIFLLYDSTNKSFALWKSDGTAAGTKAVTDTAFTNMQIVPPLRVIGNKIFFTATTPQYGSELWVGTLDGSFTPQLISFNGELSNTNDAKLDWSTLNEESIHHFNLQRSIDGVHFSTITNAVVNNNQSLQKNYQYTDNNITQLNTNNVYYRLAIFNQDGDSSISKVVGFNFSNKISLIVQPNPVSNNFKLQINNVHAAQKINIQVFNIAGIKLVDRIEMLTTGSNNFNYNTALWAAGTYITRITFADGSKQEIKISKQ